MAFLIWFAEFMAFQLLAEALRPKPKVDAPTSASLKDLSFPTVDPLRPHQWLVGRHRIDNGNLFFTDDFEAELKSHDVKSGFFSSTKVYDPTEYYVAFGMVLCAGAGANLQQIWLGDRLAYSSATAGAGDGIGSGQSVVIDVEYTDPGQTTRKGMKALVEFYSGPTAGAGSLIQSPYLVSKRGADSVPYWPNMTYVVVRGVPGSGHGGAWIGTSTIVEQLKFVVGRFPSNKSISSGGRMQFPTDANGWNQPNGQIVWAESQDLGVIAYPYTGPDYATNALPWMRANGVGQVNEDANPAWAIAELLTDVQCGAGISPLAMNWPTFKAAADVLSAEQNGVSILWDSQRVVGDVILEILKQIGGVLQPNPVTDLLELRLLRATDTPVITLDDSNIDRLNSFSRSAMDEATNTLTLNYTARNDKWQQVPVEVQDGGAEEISGQPISASSQYVGITNAALANTLAVRDLRALSSPLAAASVSAIVPKSTKFLPGDVVLLHSPKNGIEQIRMRVTTSSYSQPGQALCSLDLIEDIFTAGLSLYANPETVTNTASTALPGTVAGKQLTMVAPYGLSQDNADRMLYAIAPADTSQLYADVAFANTDDATYPKNVSYAAAGQTYPLSVHGTLSAATAWDKTGTVAIKLSAANKAALMAAVARLGSSLSAGVPAVLFSAATSSLNVPVNKHEFITITGVTSTGALTANVTVSARGAFDTWPRKWLANANIVLLTGKAIAPAPLNTAIAGSAGTVIKQAGTPTAFARTWARYRNGLGTNATWFTQALYSGQDGTHDSEERALRQAMPGNVQLDGMLGAYAATDATLPTVALAGRETVPLTWVNRGFGDASSWFAPTESVVIGSNALYNVWKVSAEDGTVTSLAAGRVAGAVQTVDISTEGLVEGDQIRVTVQVVETVGADDIGPVVQDFELDPGTTANGLVFTWGVAA